MIGGADIVFPSVADPAALAGCAGIVARFWRGARYEDAVTGDKFRRVADIPFGKVRELLAYPNAKAEAAWDTDDSDSPENSMLHLIARPGEITIVVDNPQTPEMQSIQRAIRTLLWAYNANTFVRATT
jgi:hypothetical protein